jgi:hypothetical protein
MKYRKSDLAGKRYAVGVADTIEGLEELLNAYPNTWKLNEVKQIGGKYLVIMEKV